MAIHPNYINGTWTEPAEPAPDINPSNVSDVVGEYARARRGAARGDGRVDAMVAEFQPEAVERLSHSAQLHITRALVRNAVERLALANTRLAR